VFGLGVGARSDGAVVARQVTAVVDRGLWPSAKLAVVKFAAVIRTPDVIVVAIPDPDG
jgi:hypothetical protein